MPELEEPEEPFVRDPTRVVVAGYLLAAVCLIVPLAVIGGVFAGFALIRRNRTVDGVAIILLSLAGTALAVTVLR